ncbi:MAG: hypothetical protein Ct9H300mP27_04270 [Chloroflexota bacterium]|nr:MAG: hypothetical protein Ct9H300mP27_04270 [Chloroflexota bacterium]
MRPGINILVTLSGYPELEVADGSKGQMGPGDVLVAEDLTGHGHILRHLGMNPGFPFPSLWQIKACSESSRDVSIKSLSPQN